MPSTSLDNIKDRLYFRDMRFRLSAPEEFLVRFLSYVFYIVFTPAAVILLFSDVSSLRLLGVLFILFLGDRVLHVGRGERSLPELLRSQGNRLNIAPTFSPPAYRALSWAYRHARSTGRDFSLVLLSELAEHGDTTSMFRRLGVSREEFSRRARELSQREERSRFGRLTAGRRRGELLAEAERLAVRSALLACRAREAYIQPRMLFAVAVLSEVRGVQDLLRSFDISPSDVELAALMAGKHDYGHARPRFLRRSRVMNRVLTSHLTPTLNRFSEDLTGFARQVRQGLRLSSAERPHCGSEKIGFLVGHEAEYERMLDTLSRPGKLNAILVGDPGVWETSLLHRLAYRIAHDDVPLVLFDKRVVALHVPHILSGGALPEIVNRLTRITDEVIRAGDVLLFVPNMHDLFKVLGGSELRPLDVLLPIVQSGAVPLVGETYSREFKSIIEPRTDFLEQFEVILIQ